MAADALFPDDLTVFVYGRAGVLIRFEYECSHCKIFGHSTQKCLVVAYFMQVWASKDGPPPPPIFVDSGLAAICSSQLSPILSTQTSTPVSLEAHPIPKAMGP